MSPNIKFPRDNCQPTSPRLFFNTYPLIPTYAAKEANKKGGWGGAQSVNEEIEQKTHTTRYSNTILLKFILYAVARRNYFMISISFVD